MSSLHLISTEDYLALCGHFNRYRESKEQDRKVRSRVRG